MLKVTIMRQEDVAPGNHEATRYSGHDVLQAWKTV